MKDFYDSNVSKDSFSRIKNMYLTDIIQYLITYKNLLITVQKIRRGWCEIDTPEDYNYAKQFFENNHKKITDDNIS
jgi:choline kinase